MTVIGFGSLYAAANLALGDPPNAGTDPGAASHWLAANGDRIRWWLWLLTLSLPLLVGYATLLRRRLSGPHGDLVLAGAVAFVAETAVQGWMWAGLASTPAAIPADRSLLAAATYWGPVLTSTTLLMLAPMAIAGFSQEHPWPRWHGCICAIAGLEQLVETVTVFGRHGFLAAGGPMNLYLGGGLTAIALLSSAFAKTAQRPHLSK